MIRRAARAARSKARLTKRRAGRIAVDQLLLQLDHAGVLGKRKIGHVLVDLDTFASSSPQERTVDRKYCVVRRAGGFSPTL
jgi:hypothetical protein